jgi:small glutamine-rich tetratricopeptide repeat-containing protein alpha
LSETFELNDHLISSLSVADLASLIKGSSSASVYTAADKSEAERQKVLGNEFIAANKPEEAIECYSKAIKIDPSNAIYFSNRAAAYSMIGEHFKALEDAKQSCKLNPSYSKAYNRLGKAHLALGEPEEAVVAFEKALELEPKDFNIKASLEAARRAVSGDSDELAETASSANQPNSPLGGMDFSSFMNNPNFMSMAQQMMQSGALNDMLKDPKTKDMVSQFMANPDILKKFAGGK